MIWLHYQWGEYQWRREGNWKLSLGTCQRSETGGEEENRKDVIEPGSKSRKCFRREGVTLGGQSSGFRSEQLSLQWSHSVGKEEYGDKDMSYVYAGLSCRYFWYIHTRLAGSESKSRVQIWDVDLEVIGREMTFKARTVGDIIRGKCGEMRTDTMAESRKHSIWEMRADPGAHRPELIKES